MLHIFLKIHNADVPPRGARGDRPRPRPRNPNIEIKQNKSGRKSGITLFES
eukprot:SAG11_NODE_10931_length_795_cov_1.576149_1_plen_50_part_01